MLQRYKKTFLRRERFFFILTGLQNFWSFNFFEFKYLRTCSGIVWNPFFLTGWWNIFWDSSSTFPCCHVPCQVISTLPTVLLLLCPWLTLSFHTVREEESLPFFEEVISTRFLLSHSSSLLLCSQFFSSFLLYLVTEYCLSISPMLVSYLHLYVCFVLNLYRGMNRSPFLLFLRPQPLNTQIKVSTVPF